MRAQAAFITVCALLFGHPCLANVGDWYVITLKDGTTVEGKSISEDTIKVVVEFQERGITKEKTVYRRDAAEVRILTPAEVEQRLRAAAARPVATTPATRPDAPATSPVSPPSPVADPISAEQQIQQARHWLAQGRIQEAIQRFERATGESLSADSGREPQRPLKQAFAEWLQSLQRARDQTTNQLAVVKQQVTDLQSKMQRTENDLQLQLSRPPDPVALNPLQMRIMTGKRELDQRAAELKRLQQQAAMLDQQIAAIQPRVQVELAWHETILAWIRANPFWTIGALLLLWLVLKRVPSSS